MSVPKMQNVLVGSWLLAFLYCAAVALTAQPDIPNLFPQVMNELFDTFAPTLAAMLTFVYAETKVSKGRTKIAWNRDLFALLVCVAYLGALSFAVGRFAADRMSATELVDMVKLIRVRASPVVAIVLAFYFAHRISAATAQARPN